MHSVFLVLLQFADSCMYTHKYKREQYAQASNSDIRIREEKVPTTEAIRCRKNECFCAAEGLNIVGVPNFEVVVTSFQVLVDVAIEFTEFR